MIHVVDRQVVANLFWKLIYHNSQSNPQNIMENYYGNLRVSNSGWAHKFEFLGLSVGRMYGNQCQVPEQCRFSGGHAECVQVGVRNLCLCAEGYHFVDEINLCVETKGECLLFVQYISQYFKYFFLINPMVK